MPVFKEQLIPYFSKLDVQTPSSVYLRWVGEDVGELGGHRKGCLFKKLDFWPLPQTH